MSQTLTQARLKEKVHYDPETGIFTWKHGFVGCKGGTAITARNLDGYIKISVDRKHYTAHRLAWLYTTGVYPEFQIDHINGVRDDNRFWNLREATSKQNNGNRKNAKMPETGVRNVRYTPSGKYSVAIRVGSKKAHLGVYRTLKQAEEVAMAAHIEIHGEFSPFYDLDNKEKSHG